MSNSIPLKCPKSFKIKHNFQKEWGSDAELDFCQNIICSVSSSRPSQRREDCLLNCVCAVKLKTVRIFLLRLILTLTFRISHSEGEGWHDDTWYYISSIRIHILLFWHRRFFIQEFIGMLLYLIPIIPDGHT